MMGLFYGAEATMISHRLVHVVPVSATRATIVWNVHEWDVK